MKNTIKTLLIILLVLVSLLIFHALNTYFPSNIISKVFGALKLVLTPILISLIILYLINPFTKRLVKKHKVNKKVAIAISLALFLLLVSALLFFIIYFSYTQGILLYEQLTDPVFLEEVRLFLEKYNLGSVYVMINDYIENFDITLFVGSLPSLVSLIAQTVMTIILVPIFLWHMLSIDETIELTIKDNIPSKWQKNVIPILNDSNDVVVAYFKSKILSMLFLFVIFIIIYLLLGLPVGYVFLFAFLIAILDLVPYVGPTFGLVVPVIYLFAANGSNILYNQAWHLNSLTVILILVLVNAAVQFIQGNIIVPALSGKEMKINSALILGFMLFFGYILGVWGIILSIPLGGIIIVIWKHFKQSSLFKDE